MPRRPQQEWRRGGRRPRGEGHLPAQEIDRSAAPVVNDAGLGERHEFKRDVERARLQARLSCGEPSGGLALGVLGQGDGLPQEGRRCGNAAALLSTCGGPLELCGDLFVRA